jgi:hypothetical protein
MEVGDQFAGYRIESLVGRGGMGVVYRATQLDLGRPVALKLIAPEALEDGAARSRFVSEARHAASIEHPHVVPIHAAGEADGTAYFAMRFIHGDDLRTRVRRDGPLAPLAAAAILESAAAALDAIHAAGLVHRDVKPANILLAAGDHVYLTDFGLARVALARESSTGSGRWAGSLHYAAPEQIRGGRVDARADVYALGGVLVFMLTAKVPYDRDSDEATLWAHVADPPPRPSDLRRGLPRAFDAVVEKAMAKAPEDRYPSAGDLGRAAVAAAEGRRAPRRRGAVAQGAASPTGAVALPGLSDETPTLTGSTAGIDVPPPPSRRRRGLVIATAGVAAVAVAAGAVALLSGRDGTSGAAAKATPTPTKAATATATAAAATRRGPHVVATWRHVGRRPNAIAAVGHELWVTSAKRAAVTRLDGLNGGSRVQAPVIGEGGRWLAVQGGTVWVANAYENRVLGMDAATHRVVKRIQLQGSPIALAADRRNLWVAVRGPVKGGPDTIEHYDPAGRPLPGQNVIRGGINAIVLGGGALWVAEFRDNHIVRVDLRTGRMRLFSQLIVPASALAWGAGKLWGVVNGDGTLISVDPHTGRPHLRTVAHRPWKLAVAGGHVFVASGNDNALLVVNPKTMKTEKRLPMPFNPYAVTADARHVWVTGLGDDTVTRVDLR